METQNSSRINVSTLQQGEQYSTVSVVVSLGLVPVVDQKKVVSMQILLHLSPVALGLKQHSIAC